jgi:hypothetical protein
MFIVNNKFLCDTCDEAHEDYNHISECLECGNEICTNCAKDWDEEICRDCEMPKY